MFVCVPASFSQFTYNNRKLAKESTKKRNMGLGWGCEQYLEFLLIKHEDHSLHPQNPRETKNICSGLQP